MMIDGACSILAELVDKAMREDYPMSCWRRHDVRRRDDGDGYIVTMAPGGNKPADPIGQLAQLEPDLRAQTGWRVCVWFEGDYRRMRVQR